MKTRHPQRGYALISTLLILVLLVMVVVALLSIQGVDTIRSSSDRDVAEARANALFALDTAMSELQRYAGPDQAVTARTDILDDDMANPNWTGVWSATDAARQRDSVGAMLVSGNEEFDLTETTSGYPPGYHRPEVELPDGDPDVIQLVSNRPAAPEAEVRVRRQPIVDPDNRKKAGHYAYWVGDEGVKAKVNLEDPYRNSDDEDEKRLRYTVAQRTGMEGVFENWDPADDRLRAIETMGEVALLRNDPQEMEAHFHDLTTHSVGLLTDVRNGGLRRDLTLAFESDKIFEREFGARRTGVTKTARTRPDDRYILDTSRLDDFYLIPEILETALSHNSNYGRWAGGPNWGNLREYYLLYKRPYADIPFLPHPRCGVKMRHYSWNPYKHGNRGGKLDYYHRNSPISPVLARAQMNMRLRTRKNEATKRYRLELEIKPVVALWNPYNVPLSPRRYRFDWEISTYLKLKVRDKERRYDLYQLWKGGSSPWFSLNTENVDLQPGEIRLFTVDSRQQLRQRVTLVTRWDEDGAFWVTLPESGSSGSAPLEVAENEMIEVLEIGLVAATENEGWSQALKELQKHNTFMAIKYGETVGSATSSVEDSSIRMNNLWKADDRFGPQVVPPSGDAIPPFRARDHVSEPKNLGSWAYYLRTNREDDLGHRNFIDSNVRAVVANSRWDGSVEDRGWRAMGWLNDGANRALLPPGNDEPQADGLARYRGYGGSSIGATGESHLILFDVPREPLVSLGQLQHANVGRYNNEPSFVVGNSYHNIRIPPERRMVRDYAIHDTKGLYSPYGLDVFDISHYVNESLWDSWFFSTLDPDDVSGQLTDYRNGIPFPNSRYVLYEDRERLNADDFTDSEADELTYDSVGARFLVDGAFNVNSTSVEAWKAVLSSIRNVEMPIYDATTSKLRTWENGAIVFSRLTRPFDKGFDSSDAGSYENYWRGYRELTEEQITELAEELVRQIRMRGPFRSLADFVNRSLIDRNESDEDIDDTRLAGALQAALDRTVNADLDSGLTADVDPIPDSAGDFYDVTDGTEQGTGYPGYLLQGDILQALAPVLTARSDTFRIRAYGDKIYTSPDGSYEELRARAWCEAIVQRFPEPVEALEKADDENEDAYQKRNLIQYPEDIQKEYEDVDKPYFGRRFRVVSFRWLGKEDL